jgi:uncharacterized protein
LKLTASWRSALWPIARARKTLETARADFLHAQKAWAELQPLLIGPLAEGNRSWQVQFWPDKKNLVGRQVEQLVVAQPQIDAAALAKSSVVVQGLSAYEYILFDSNINLADDAQKARYCPLLTAIGERQKQLAEEILASWNSTDGMLAQMSKFPNQRYADSHEAIADVLRVQVTALDTLKKKTRHANGPPEQGHPATVPGRCLAQRVVTQEPGRQPGRCPDRLGRVDNKGLRSLLPAEQKPLADKIDAAYATSLKLFNDNQRTLNELLADDAGRAQLNAIYDSLNVVHRLHEGELAKALGIQLGFNANDGD